MPVGVALAAGLQQQQQQAAANEAAAAAAAAASPGQYVIEKEVLSCSRLFSYQN